MLEELLTLASTALFMFLLPDTSEVSCLLHPARRAFAVGPLLHLGIHLGGLGSDTFCGHFLPISARADAAVFSLSCYLLMLYHQVKNIPSKVLG